METGQSFLAAIGSWAAVIAIAFLIASGVQDGSGRKPNNHAGPVPEGVVQLTATSYLIPDLTHAPSVDLLCRDSAQHAGDVKQVKRVDDLDNAQFVECADPQTWNDPRPGSANFVAGMKAVGTSPLFVVPAGLLLLPFMLWPLKVWRENREYERQRAAARAEVAQNRLVDAEQARRELVAALTRAEDPISYDEFARGLDRVYEHATPAPDDRTPSA
jgi:hypothetical protein